MRWTKEQFRTSNRLETLAYVYAETTGDYEFGNLESFADFLVSRGVTAPEEK